MQQIKESIRLLPEQKTFLLSGSKYQAPKGSLESMNKTLIRNSDSMELAYKQASKTIESITKLDDENSYYDGNIEINLKLIKMAALADECREYFDGLLVNANPYILQIEKHKNRDRR